MAIAKRIVLFLAVNILVMFTINIVLGLLGVHGYLSANGIDYRALMIFCLVWGMGGAFISLLISKPMAKWSMGVQIIDPNTNDPTERELIGKVHALARAAGLPKMPEVGIYPSPEVNAFATGATRSSSLVAVSMGLLQRMRKEEVEGVLAHEISHVANGDMVTMTLIQGIVNAFAMFLARILAFAIANASRRDDSQGSSYFMQHMLSMMFEMVFLLLGSIVVAWFSRWREFRADAGGAGLAGREKMVSALKALQRMYELNNAVPETAPSVQSFKISGRRSGLLNLFASHPPLETRIARLQGAI